VWVAVAIGAVGFALVLGATVFVRASARGAVRAGSAAVGLSLAIANGLVLEGDYPAVHLMLGWLAALTVAHAVEGLAFPVPLSRRARQVALGLLGVLSLASLVVPPPQAVRRRLLALPSAVAAPFVARLQPEADAKGRDLLPSAVRKSPWFKKRKSAKAVPPSGALVLPEPKLVLFLTIDATRADVLDDANEKKLPTLFRLKSKGAWFTMARATASSTRPSMASVFTGRYYSQLKFKGSGTKTVLDDRGPRFPQLLTDAGVHTVSLPLLFRISAESGVGRGFEKEFRDVLGAAATVKKLIELAKQATGPTFLYAHFGEPHAPYTGKGSTPRERYLDEVRTVDRELGRLVSALNDAGLGKRALYMISADHGEAFMEHGVGNHSRVIYEEVARVPLVVYGPGVEPREIDEPVSLIDVAPTLLDLFGVATPGPLMGQSLVPLLAGRDVSLERPIAIQATHGLAGLYVENHKVIFDFHARTVEVYDLAEDPGEKRNLADSDDRAVRAAIQTAQRFMQVNGKAKRSYDLGGD
jgi:arylsulfatase A-like enzyme